MVRKIDIEYARWNIGMAIAMFLISAVLSGVLTSMVLSPNNLQYFSTRMVVGLTMIHGSTLWMLGIVIKKIRLYRKLLKEIEQ